MSTSIAIANQVSPDKDRSVKTQPDLRLFEIVGDCYEPALRPRDMVMVAATDRFLYDGEYLLDFGDGEAPYLASRSASGFSVRHPNPRYARHDLTRSEFHQAVRAIVVAEIKVKDERLVRTAYGQRVAA